MANNIFCPKMSISRCASFMGTTIQAVHAQLKTKELMQHCPRVGNRLYITHAIAKVLLNINFRKTIITDYMLKGGVGKTTSVYHIGWCANSYGAKVLLIDTEPQANLTKANKINAENKPILIDVLVNNIPIEQAVVNISEGLDIIPSKVDNAVLDNHLVYRKIPLNTFFNDTLTPIINNYDFILIDCPPSLGLAVTSAVLFADIVLIPLHPDSFSEDGLRTLKNEIMSLNKLYKKEINFKVFLNEFDNSTVLSNKMVSYLISDKDLDGHVLKTIIREAQEIPNLIAQGQNLFSVLKKIPVKKDFEQLTIELLNICHK